MTVFIRSVFFGVALLALPSISAMAQANNPDNAGGSSGSMIAKPTYPTGTGRNPALTSGLPSGNMASLPASKNPTVAGATGHTVVPGDNSTVTGDRVGTATTKTNK